MTITDTSFRESTSTADVREFCWEKKEEGYDGVVIGHYHAQVKATPNDGGFPCVYINTGCWEWGKYHYTLLEGGEFTYHSFRL